MSTMVERLNEYMANAGIRPFSVKERPEDYDEDVERLSFMLSKAQKTEVQEIVDEFFEDMHEQTEISDEWITGVKCDRTMRVGHVGCKKNADMINCIRAMIIQGLIYRRVGGEFDVNVNFHGVYDGDIMVKNTPRGCGYMDEFEIVVIIEPEY